MCLLCEFQHTPSQNFQQPIFIRQLHRDYSSVKTSAYPGTKKFVHHCHVKALALAGAPDACETYDSLAPSQLLTCKFRHLIKPLRLSTSFSMPVQRRRVHFPSNSIFGRPAIASPMHAPQPVMRYHPSLTVRHSAAYVVRQRCMVRCRHVLDDGGFTDVWSSA